MNLEEWCKKSKILQESLEKIKYLQYETHYTDEEIIEAIENVKEAGVDLGFTYDDAIDLIKMCEFEFKGRI